MAVIFVSVLHHYILFVLEIMIEMYAAKVRQKLRMLFVIFFVYMYSLNSLPVDLIS